MNKDIFDFREEAAPNDTTHPHDRYVLDRVSHGFDLLCLPGPCSGPLRTAPVVLLCLAPGWSQEDVDEVKRATQNVGEAINLLKGPEDHRPG